MNESVENERTINLEGLNADSFEEFCADDLLSYELLMAVYDIRDLAERARIRALLILAARRKGVEKDVKEVLKAYDANDAKLQFDYEHDQSFTTMFSFDHEPLKCGYWIADDNGVRMQNAAGKMTYATKTPVVPVALLENVNSETEKVKLAFFKNRYRTIICDRQITASHTKIVQLADKGIEVTSENAKMLVRYISDCINYNQLPYLRAYSQLGWNNGHFIPYSDDAVFDGEDESKQLFNAITEHGDYDRWIALTHDMRSNLLVRLTMAASFASVLIEKVRALPFVFHLWGDTGTGKSVALKVAMSIWGNPKLGKLTRSLNMTVNSLMSTAAFLNNLPFGGDELQTIKDPNGDYDKLIMNICEGVDRGRMDSANKLKEAKHWNCSFIFTGEDPCSHNRSGGGVMNRIIQAEVTESLCVNHSGNEIVSCVEDNYGHAGKVFIEHVSGIENLSEQFKAIRDEIMAHKDTTEKQALPMALMLLADKLACQCIYKNEAPLSVSDGLPFLSSADDVNIAERAYEWLNDFINRNQNRFEPADNHGELWGNIRDKFIWFNKSVLEDELKKAGFDFNAVKKRWASKGYLIKLNGRYSTVTTVHGSIPGRYVKLSQRKKDLQIDDTNFEEKAPF